MNAKISKTYFRLQMVGVFVKSPQQAIITAWNLVFCDPLAFVRVATTFSHQASNKSRMTHIDLQPLFIGF